MLLPLPAWAILCISSSCLWRSWPSCRYLGTLSGFGLRLAQSALKRGNRVIATARSLEKLEDVASCIDPALRNNLRTLQLDVTDTEAVLKAKADEAYAIWGQILVLDSQVF
ncbi:hypothetical protein C0991_004101 [Blastosporella zonata]|nr:hypothetical protein C0991_004101 [Blastosporella zonata]